VFFQGIPEKYGCMLRENTWTAETGVMQQVG